MRKIIALFVVIMNICCIKVSALSAKSAVLIDGMSGRVLYEHNAYEKLPMASTTKIMTGFIACLNGNLNAKVKTSAFASGTEGSSLWLKVGEEQSLINLIYGLLLKSGNDSAVAIAEYIAGSTDAFALLMNKKAREIGALNTNFINPHGLDAEGHYTTAYDLALISKEAMKNETFKEVVSTKQYTIPMKGEKWGRALKNHNKLLWQYEGCNGIKTGFTKKCGRCLVSSAERDGKNLICVTLNDPDDWKDHSYLLDYGFSEFKGKTVTKKGEKITEYTFDSEYKRKATLICTKDCTVMIGENDVITTETIILKKNMPVDKDEVVGKLKVFCNGKEIEEIDLVSDKTLRELNLWKKIIYKIKK